MSQSSRQHDLQGALEPAKIIERTLRVFPICIICFYTLTAGTNKFTGDSGDDTFDGGLTTSSLQTLNSGDQLDGGAGNDELFAVVNGSVTPTVLKNIETVSITNTAAASIIDLSNATGITSLTSQGATNTTTLQGISLDLAPTVQDTTFAHTITFASATGSSDAATINVQNVTGSAILTAASIETLTLNSAGSATNVLGVPVFDSATELVITGTAGVTIGTLATTAALVTNVDASALAPTSGVGATIIIAGASATTISGSSGNDTLTITTSTNSDTVSGGAGDDAIAFTAGFTTGDSVDGGDGTDSLKTTFALMVTASAATPTTYTVSNIETLITSDDTMTTNSYTPTNISAAATALTFAGAGLALSAGAQTHTVVGPAGSFALNLGASSAGNVGVFGTDTFTITDTGTATTDSLTINNKAVNSTTGAQLAVFGTSVLGITGYETVTINNGAVGAVAQTLGTVTLAGDAGADTTLNLTGANNITLGVVTASAIDASALTSAGTAIGAGTSTLQMVTGSTATTITGSAGIDNLFGNTSTASSISAGAGADSITAGSGADTILGGAGADSIVSGGGSDSIDGGADNDTVFMLDTLTAADTIAGGDGTDTLNFTTTVHTAAKGARVSGFEVLAVGTALTGVDMSVYSNNTGFTRVNVVTGTSTITNAGAAVTDLGIAAATTTATFTRATDTTADALKVRVVDAATTTAVTASGEETITLHNASSTTVATEATITTLSAAALTTLNISGSGGMIVTNAITGATSLATVVDSHTGGGDLTLNLSNSTVATTFTGSANGTGTTTLTMGSGKNIVNHAGTGNIVVTGGSAAESMTGSTGADTLSGGSGNDTLIGGSGADSISGGSGADSISGGAGADTISTDSGADTIDGGDGTDILALSAAFTDLTADTITNVETLNMGGYAGTMSLANFNAFTTMSNVGAVTLSDAGTVAANSTVLAYVLASGTNTWTASTTALVNTLTGSSGTDTFNFGLLSDAATQSYLATDVINGGDGSSDVINFTGNIAFATALTNITLVENLVFDNTTTAVTATILATNTTTSGGLTVDASSEVSGIATLDGTLAPQAVNIIGGAAADVLTGSVFADSITGNDGIDVITGLAGIDAIDGGAGADVIDAGNGADSITGGYGDDALTGGLLADTFIFSSTAAANGADTIADFVSATDILNLDAYMDGITKVFFTAATVATDITNAANVIVVGGGSTIAATAAAIAADATVTATTGIIVIDDGTDSYVYYSTDLAGDGTETLVATLTGVADASALVTADFIFA